MISACYVDMYAAIQINVLSMNYFGIYLLCTVLYEGPRTLTNGDAT